jgi:excisionase family DNA binding protein
MGQIILREVSLNDLRNLIAEVFRDFQGNTPPNKKPSDEREYLSRAEVAKLLRVSLFTLNDWTKQGHLKAYRIGKRVLYDRAEVIASLQEVKSIKYRRGVNHGS